MWPEVVRRWHVGMGLRRCSHTPGVSGRAKGQAALGPEKVVMLRGPGPRSTEVSSVVWRLVT